MWLTYGMSNEVYGIVVDEGATNVDIEGIEGKMRVLRCTSLEKGRISRNFNPMDVDT
jgi:hypothetical protein